VAEALSKKLGLAIALVGSSNERPIAEAIQSRLHTDAAVLSGKTSLETLIGVLAESSLMLTNDSGPMHIAAALGTPTVAVFGSTDERVTSPFGLRTSVVKEPVDCSPCLLRDCPIDHRCMKNVSVDAVYRAAMELLAGQP
jgi:heptosyltransferase-2